MDLDSSESPPSPRPSVGDVNPITDARNHYLNHTPREPPPTSRLSPLFKKKGFTGSFVPCGRPHCSEHDCADTFPPILLHRAFSQLLYNRETIELTAEDHYLTTELENAMSRFYDDEESRIRSIGSILADYGVSLRKSTKITKTNYTIDASAFVNEHPYVIAEFENEIVGGNGDPYPQALAHYVESTRENAIKYPGSPLPCLLLCIFGPCIVTACAAWNLKPTSQPTDRAKHYECARHLAAVRKAIRSLRQYYEEELGDTEDNLGKTKPPPQQIFPFKTTYESLQGSGTVKFRYDRDVSEERIVCLATEVNHEQRIYVKFTPAYSKEAHNYLASLGHAPVLRGLEKITLNWIMPVFDTFDDFERLRDRKQPLSSSTFDAISAILRKFHEAGFVHGDIRDANIMVSKTDETEVMIAGFDWAGRKGEARYPCLSFLEPETVTKLRPSAELDGELILEEHDMFMLNRLREAKE